MDIKDSNEVRAAIRAGLAMHASAKAARAVYDAAIQVARLKHGFGADAAILREVDRVQMERDRVDMRRSMTFPRQAGLQNASDPIPDNLTVRAAVKYLEDLFSADDLIRYRGTDMAVSELPRWTEGELARNIRIIFYGDREDQRGSLLDMVRNRQAMLASNQRKHT